MMSTEVHMNTDVFHFCILLDTVTYIDKFATAQYKLKFWCQCGNTITQCFGLKPKI